MKASTRIALEDQAGTFDVTVLDSASPSRILLFAVGGGGDPDRHLPLMASLAEQGCAVVAPHFERLVVPRPTEADLLLRARRLRLALDALALPDLTVAGVGHSIGAAMLLALAGGQAWLGPAQPLDIAPEPRLDRLVLLAPATGFFQAPGALEGVRTPILAWAGSLDTITPPAQTQLLRQALGASAAVDVRVAEGADHFSFMNVRPPMMAEPLADRDAFLADLAAAVCEFVVR
jgi:alpha-beta hydrolase superfamily lysophospholipase